MYPNSHWASLGAWVTILLLAVDPFMQAVITYPGQLDTVPNTKPSLVRASRLDMGNWLMDDAARVSFTGNEPFAFLFRMSPDISFGATAQIGFFNTSASRATQPSFLSCPSGNCTWPTYSSLGICASCADISSHILKEPGTGMPSGCDLASYTYVENITTYRIRLPGGRQSVVLDAGNGGPSKSCPEYRHLTHQVGVSIVFQPNDTISFQDSDTLLASFAVLQAPDDYWDNKTNWEDAAMVGTECAVSFCGSVYGETTLRNGLLDNPAVLHTLDRRPESFHSLQPASPDIVDGYFKNSLTLNYTSPMVFPMSDLQLTVPKGANLPPDVQQTFNISQKTIETTIAFFRQNSTLDAVKEAFAGSTNISATFEEAANLMSNRIREADGTVLEGTVQQWTIHTEVRWHFIIFPALAFLASSVFFVGTVVESRRLRLETMKDGLLGVLLHGLDGDLRSAIRGQKRSSAQGLESTHVRLEDVGGGLELRFSGKQEQVS